jgi:hypothetical protein
MSSAVVDLKDPLLVALPPLMMMLLDVRGVAPQPVRLRVHALIIRTKRKSYWSARKKW